MVATARIAAADHGSFNRIRPQVPHLMHIFWAHMSQSQKSSRLDW